MKKSFVSILSISLLMLFSGFVQAQSADEIIDKYITAIGGKDKWKLIQSLQVDGQIEVQGVVIPFTTKAIHNKGSRLDAEFQGNKIIEIVTPEKGWSQNPLGGKPTLQPMDGEELKDKQSQLDIQNPLIDYAAKGSTVEFIGKDEEDGNEYYKVRLTIKSGKQSTYFFDTKTYLVYKEESTVKQQGQEVVASQQNLDYQTLDFGVKIPFKVQVGGLVIATKKVVVNPAISESIFKPE